MATGKVALKRLFPLIYHIIEYDLVYKLFDGSAIIGEIYRAAMLLANIAEREAVLSYLCQVLVCEGSCIDMEVVERRMGIGGDNHAVSEARCIDDVDVGEDGVHSLSQRFDQPEIGGCAASIDGDHARRRQMIAHSLEKFARGQLKGHVGLLVGIDGNVVVLLVS